MIAGITMSRCLYNSDPITTYMRTSKILSKKLTNLDLVVPLSNLLKKETVMTIFRMKTRKPKPATESQIGKESAVKLKAKT